MTTPNILTSSPPAPATAALQSNLVTQCYQALQTKYLRDKIFLKEMGSFIFDSTVNGGLTPQQAIASLGTFAAGIFGMMNAYLTFLNSLGVETVPSPIPAGWTFTANSDGSGTLTGPS